MNIFLTGEHNVKVGDLGEALQLERTTQLARTHVGTRGYMSPEIVDGLPYSYKSDIWSAGCVLYQLCTLRLPFEAQGERQMMNMIVNDPHESISPRYSRKLSNLVDWLLSKSPEERPDIRQVVSECVPNYIRTDFNQSGVRGADQRSDDRMTFSTTEIRRRKLSGERK